MKPAEPLLQALSRGHFVSGERLASELGVSRAAVWKRLRRLRAAGVPIDAVRGRGYRIAGGNPLLDREEILNALTLPARSRLHDVAVHWRLESTNSQLLARDYAGLPAACLAEMQTAGRGRHGRGWISPFGGGVWLSLGWPFDQLPAGFTALGLVAGIATADALRALGVRNIGLKWPNDLVVGAEKLGGLLVETRGEAGGRMRAVIGVGINWRLPAPAMPEGMDQPWTDLARATGEPPPRAQLAAQVINQLCQAIDLFERSGFAVFGERWRELDVLAGRQVFVHAGGREFSGIARGIDTEGALIVAGDGRVERCTAGDVSVRSS